jgi:hypothetical protein
MEQKQRKDVHVTYSYLDHEFYGKYKWHVRSEMDRRPAARGIFRGKFDAVIFGAALARRLKTELVIHNKYSGKIKEKDSFGNDPRSRKG